MKKIIMAILLLFVYSVSNAQEQSISDAKPAKSDGEELYKLWMKAFKHIDKYEYDNQEEMKEVRNSSKKLKGRSREVYNEIAQLLMARGFQFNKQNDTLLFQFSISDYSRYPNFIYVQSSSVKKSYTGRTENNIFSITPYEPRVADMFLMEDIPLLYAGDVDGFRELFIQKGSYATGGAGDVAWRIILKDEEIISSKLWIYRPIFDERAFDPQYR